MFYTNDPVSDYDYYSIQQEKQLEKLPVCRECGEHIQDEYAYRINDEYICNECMEDFRVEILLEDYL